MARGLRVSAGLAALVALATGSPASAYQETTTFCYDALGRLLVSSSDASADDTAQSFAYDNADNRAQQTVSDTTEACDFTDEALLAQPETEESAQEEQPE